MLVRSQNNRSYWQICARHGFPRPAWSVASVLESETVKVLTHSIMPVLVFRATPAIRLSYRSRGLTSSMIISQSDATIDGFIQLPRITKTGLVARRMTPSATLPSNK